MTNTVANWTASSTTSATVDLSTLAYLGGLRASGLVFPAGWVSGTVSFQASLDGGVTFHPVYSNGSLYSVSAVAGNYEVLDFGTFSAISAFQIISSVTQTSAVSVAVVTVDPAKTAGLGGGSGGGGGGSNASVGTNGATAPTSSTENGFINSAGNLVGVSPSNPLPVTGGAASVGSALYAASATVGTTAAALPSNTLVTGVNIYNPVGNQVVYAGPAGVTTSTGFPIFPGGGPVSLPVNNTNLIYLISGTAGQVVNYVAV